MLVTLVPMNLLSVVLVPSINCAITVTNFSENCFGERSLFYMIVQEGA